jgi:oxygen-independent coproporphyrinogen-3 oxidase
MEILLSDYEYQNDLFDVAREFCPATLDDITTIKLEYKLQPTAVEMEIQINSVNGQKHFSKQFDTNNGEGVKSRLKLGLYDALAEYFDKQLPYGCLTGVRPTKVAYSLMNNGLKLSQIPNYFRTNYRVSNEKIKLILEILENQKPIERNDVLVDFYVNIPFCTTKCSYCSFISAPIDKVQNYVSPYVDALLKEIEYAKQMIRNNCYIVKNVYIGGGTPTAIPTKELERILSSLTFGEMREFTVEAGRPDTITKEKLDLLQKYHVTRISVNPQTFNDEVLKNIGRAHSAIDTIKAYELARTYNFVINMDLIAGLPGETIKSFKNSIDTVIDLAPENITVHTLCLKRASAFAIESENIFKTTKTQKMLEYAKKQLQKSGYKPYYLYRQKNQVDNLENVGYFKGKTICRFNIESMEETASIIACGANAISKRFFSLENRIEREANVKDIPSYITRIGEMIQRKKDLFENKGKI